MASFGKIAAAAALSLAATSNALSVHSATISAHNTTAATKAGSLPPLPADFPEDALKQCKNDQMVLWQEHGDTTKLFLDAWTAGSNGGAIVKDTGDSSCLTSGDASSNKVMTLVSEPEEAVCKFSPPGPRKAEDGEFTVSGKMAELKATRKYQIMWPADGTCSEDKPCPVMIFFHGCAAMVLPAMQASADDTCFSNLNTVMIMPKLEKDEKWTTDGTSILDEFILPLWESLQETHGAKLDTNRVAVMGASLGSGMALQAGLLHPDKFSLVVAAGLADGSHCEDAASGGKVEWDSSAVLAGNSAPSGDKLKGIVVVMAEKETELDTRLSALLQMVPDKTPLNMRLYANAGHATGILYTFNQWSGMHDTIFKGLF